MSRNLYRLGVNGWFIGIIEIKLLTVKEFTVDMLIKHPGRILVVVLFLNYFLQTY